MSVFKILLLVLLFTAFQSSGQTHKNNLTNGLALKGYDPVSYFSGKPLKGSESINYKFQNSIYHFSDKMTLATFILNPNKYIPSYGGWCAYAMGKYGSKVEVDPQTFKIIDGKLYLYYNAYFNNTLKKWNEDELTLKVSADNNWKKQK